MNERAFFDTNVLLYAHDRLSIEKGGIARALLRDHVKRRLELISTQVLQEFFVNATNPRIGMPVRRAREVVAGYARLNIVVVTSLEILGATQIQERYQISFGDALILAAAKSGQAGVLFTEDLSDGQVYDGVKVENPFRRLPN